MTMLRIMIKVICAGNDFGGDCKKDETKVAFSVSAREIIDVDFILIVTEHRSHECTQIWGCLGLNALVQNSLYLTRL